jgi:hypothetical protein
MRIALAFALLLLANAAPAVDPAIGVPVYPGDLRENPYTIIGEVQASAGKFTPFSNDADQAKLYRALWKRAQKLGADAVINVRYGDAHVSAFSWGKTNVTGTAVKFR